MSAQKWWIQSRHLEMCCGQIAERIVALRRRKALRHALVSHDEGTSRFQLLEFFGDSVLHYRVTRDLMRTRRFLTPHILTEMRMAITSNSNLARVYDVLGIAAVVEFAPAESGVPRAVNAEKTRADVMEAIIGELAEISERAEDDSSGSDPDQQQQQQQPQQEPEDIAKVAAEVLDDLLMLISYTGEQQYYSALGAGEAAAAAFTMQEYQRQQQQHQQQPALRPTTDERRMSRGGGGRGGHRNGYRVPKDAASRQSPAVSPMVTPSASPSVAAIAPVPPLAPKPVTNNSKPVLQQQQQVTQLPMGLLTPMFLSSSSRV
jgi:hypothetical protein